MKTYTFEDLEFYPHPHFPRFQEQAVLEFTNGWGLSVINGNDAYCDNKTYEVAVLWRGNLDCSTDITDDVLPYQTPEQITEIMKKLQTMKPKKD